MMDVQRFGKLDTRGERLAPMGIPCGWCDEYFDRDDSGVFRLVIGSNGCPVTIPFHTTCDIRMTVGSVGHLRRECNCYGGTSEDPDGLTKRQAAIYAANEWYELRQL